MKAQLAILRHLSRPLQMPDILSTKELNRSAGTFIANSDTFTYSGIWGHRLPPEIREEEEDEAPIRSLSYTDRRYTPVEEGRDGVYVVCSMLSKSIELWTTDLIM